MNTAAYGAAVPSRTGSPASRLRITRRGYSVLTVLITAPVIFTALAASINGGGAAATDSASNASFAHVTVQAGESLWQLAGEVAPHSDPREVIADIMSLNQLGTSTLQPGQSIAIPLKYSR